MISHFNDRAFHATDPKGRLLLPKEIRAEQGIKKADTLYLVPNLSDPPYLEVRTASQWDGYCTSLRDQDAGEKKKDSYRYAMLFKEKVTVDGQGRVMLPQRIRDLCKLNGDVAVINMDVYVEVWCKDHVETKYADMVRAFKDSNDRMF